jgi:hypothetical protein
MSLPSMNNLRMPTSRMKCTTTKSLDKVMEEKISMSKRTGITTKESTIQQEGRRASTTKRIRTKATTLAGTAAGLLSSMTLLTTQPMSIPATTTTMMTSTTMSSQGTSSKRQEMTPGTMTTTTMLLTTRSNTRLRRERVKELVGSSKISMEIILFLVVSRGVEAGLPRTPSEEAGTSKPEMERQPQLPLTSRPSSLPRGMRTLPRTKPLGSLDLTCKLASHKPS